MLNILLLLFLFCTPKTNDVPIKYMCQYPLDKSPKKEIDAHLQGIWKLREDTNANNYFIVERDGDYHLSLTYMNRGGDNRGLEHFRATFSEVNGIHFMNAPYSSFSIEDNFKGIVLLRIDPASLVNRSWEITAKLVTDSNLYKMKSSEELRAYVSSNMNKPDFYGKELHFKKKFEFNSFR